MKELREENESNIEEDSGMVEQFSASQMVPSYSGMVDQVSASQVEPTTPKTNQKPPKVYCSLTILFPY